MSRTVTINAALGRQPKPEGPEPERVPRVARLLALAHRWNDLIRSGAIRDRAELSRLVGVSRARISQVMRLLDLAPDIQEAVLGGQIDGVAMELDLRRTADEPVWERQRALFDAASRASV